MQLRVIVVGSVAGAGGSALALAACSGVGGALGGALALMVGAGAGAVGAWLGGRCVVRRAIERLEAIGPDEGEPAEPSPGNWTRLDERLAATSEAIERGRAARSTLDEVERTARVLRQLADLADGSSPADTATAPRGVLGFLAEFHRTAAPAVRDASAVGEAAGRMAAGASDGAEAVARTTTIVEALSQDIDRISQNADAAAEAAERARAEARLGLEQVHGVVEGMDRLRAHVEANGRKVRRLGDRSVEIGAIVGLIDGISGRTDMLALNATIESVRAGEHGRGFAVVAEEIRKLAERTAAATREIGALVEAIQADTHESIRALAEEQVEVEQESARAREAGSALGRISEVAEQSARLVEGISRSANAQVRATQDLVRAMQRISEVSHQAQEGSGRACEHARALSRRCERLVRLSDLEPVPAAAPAPAKARQVPDSLPISGPHARLRPVPVEPSA
jgi:twitching motility protein PilJ